MNSYYLFQEAKIINDIFQQNRILKLIWDSENYGCFLTLPTEGKTTAADADCEGCSYRSHRNAFRDWLNVIRLDSSENHSDTVMQSLLGC